MKKLLLIFLFGVINIRGMENPFVDDSIGRGRSPFWNQSYVLAQSAHKHNVEHVPVHLNQVAMQVKQIINDMQQKNQDDAMLRRQLFLQFKTSSAYTHMKNFLAVPHERMLPKEEAKLRAQYGKLLLRMMPGDSDEFEEGYELVKNAVATQLLDDEEKKHFRDVRKWAERARPDLVQQRKKTVTKPDASPEISPAAQKSEAVNSLPEIIQMQPQDESQDNSVSPLHNQQQAKKGRKRKNRKKNNANDPMKHQLKSNDCDTDDDVLEQAIQENGGRKPLDRIFAGRVINCFSLVPFSKDDPRPCAVDIISTNQEHQYSQRITIDEFKDKYQAAMLLEEELKKFYNLKPRMRIKHGQEFRMLAKFLIPEDDKTLKVNDNELQKELLGRARASVDLLAKVQKELLEFSPDAS